MEYQEKVQAAFVELLAAITEKSAEEVTEHLEDNMHDSLGVTSVQLFPLLAGLEEQFDIELDYAEFITDVKTAKEGIAYVSKLLRGKEQKNGSV